jgi:flagellar basal-body rod protein FlgB
MPLLDRVEALRGTLDYHLARHNVLASNLAQVDTPNYRPVDLARTGSSFSGALALATSEGERTPAPAEASYRVIADPTTAAGLDGNGVDVDREAVKIASNQIRFDVLAQLASSELANLAWVASDGRNG